jgi:Uma2 family endonuclease
MSILPILPEDPQTIRRLDRDEYVALAATGAFDDERVELIDGVILTMSPQGPPHVRTLSYLTEALIDRLGKRARVVVQSSLALGARSQPEPDLYVVPREHDWQGVPARALLVVEVSDSTLRYDRTTKASLYAESDVPEYWIVNLIDGVVEVHTAPLRGRYSQVRTVGPGQPIALASFPDVTVDPASFLL